VSFLTKAVDVHEYFALSGAAIKATPFVLIPLFYNPKTQWLYIVLLLVDTKRSIIRLNSEIPRPF
jgi:hypothetical protein